MIQVPPCQSHSKAIGKPSELSPWSHLHDGISSNNFHVIHHIPWNLENYDWMCWAGVEVQSAQGTGGLCLFTSWAVNPSAPPPNPLPPIPSTRGHVCECSTRMHTITNQHGCYLMPLFKAAMTKELLTHRCRHTQKGQKQKQKRNKKHIWPPGTRKRGVKFRKWSSAFFPSLCPSCVSILTFMSVANMSCKEVFYNEMQTLHNIPINLSGGSLVIKKKKKNHIVTHFVSISVHTALRYHGRPSFIFRYCIQTSHTVLIQTPA